ncbi:hypothetical protein D3C75_888120 [compost metagenome]
MSGLQTIKPRISISFEVGNILIRFQHPVIVNHWRFIAFTEFVGLNGREIREIRMVGDYVFGENCRIHSGHYRFTIGVRLELCRHIRPVQTGGIDEISRLHPHLLCSLVHQGNEFLFRSGHLFCQSYRGIICRAYRHRYVQLFDCMFVALCQKNTRTNLFGGIFLNHDFLIPG